MKTLSSAEIEAAWLAGYRNDPAAHGHEGGAWPAGCRSRPWDLSFKDAALLLAVRQLLGV